MFHSHLDRNLKLDFLLCTRTMINLDIFNVTLTPFLHE